MKKKEWLILAMGALACIAMSLIETVWKPVYFVKSALKVVIFLGTIGAVCVCTRTPIRELLNIRKPKKAKTLFWFLGLSYVAIIAGFFLFKNMIDLDALRQSLLDKEGLTKRNCLYVFSYIILCNSFLEESFFRGFLFRGLKKNRRAAYLLSSLLFALYHIGIVGSWFNPLVLVVCIIGLMLAGIVLDFVSEHYDSLFASYAVHACANLAINTIGVYMIFFAA